MSKVSNLEANSSVAATLPVRPASFTGGANNRASEPQYSTLNNLDTIRSYGSAADDLDGPPHSACQYLQNFNKPTASVAPSMAATASDMSATNTLEKSYRDMDKNIKPSYYDMHKIQNDLTDPQLAALNRIQLPPLDKPRREGGATALSSPETPDYHWDCSDWVRTSQNPLPNITEVTGSEVKDTSSYHSNESNESNTAVRAPASVAMADDDDVLETLNEDQTSDYVGEGDGDDITSDLDTLPEPTDFDRILSAHGIELGGSASELSSVAGGDLAYGLAAHPNLYLPAHSGADTDGEADGLLHRLDRYRYPARNRLPLQLGTYAELESLTAGSQSEDGGQLCDIESDDASSRI
ncbi:fat-like cadherin-related tumor suppressor homolog [Pollicipes pollicipes]|nr:fat-like cadherin-related tumor suppressor homolog [Pollicipes pollicipes]